jgi:DNA-binding transcriptional LysR family regulator
VSLTPPGDTGGAHTRWARRRRIDLIDLVDEPWIIPPPHTWTYKFLAEVFQARGLEMPKASLVTVSEPLRCSLLESGSFVTMLPNLWLCLQAKRYSLKALPVELSTPPWPMVIVTLKNRTLSPVVERFIACVREVAKSLTGGTA